MIHGYMYLALISTFYGYSGSLIYFLPKISKLFGLPIFVYEHTRWRLFKKGVVGTELDMYLRFIYYNGGW
jgi:hypothetical protein